MADQRSDDSDTTSEEGTVRRNQEAQNSDLEYFARMYVLRQENVYLERQSQLERTLLQNEVDKNSKIKQEIKQKQKEISQIKKAKARQKKLEHVHNQRGLDFITGSFCMFWRSLETSGNNGTIEETKSKDVFGSHGPPGHPELSLEGFFSLEEFSDPSEPPRTQQHLR